MSTFKPIVENSLFGIFTQDTQLGNGGAARHFVLKITNDRGDELSVAMDNSLGDGGHHVVRTNAMIFRTDGTSEEAGSNPTAREFLETLQKFME